MASQIGPWLTLLFGFIFATVVVLSGYIYNIWQYYGWTSFEVIMLGFFIFIIFIMIAFLEVTMDRKKEL